LVFHDSLRSFLFLSLSISLSLCLFPLCVFTLLSPHLSLGDRAALAEKYASANAMEMVLDVPMATEIHSLWKDPAIQKAYASRAKVREEEKKKKKKKKKK
jgi:hypothetical protein